MKICYAVVLAALVGAGIGGLAVERLHAQAKPPAYYIAEIDVTNEDLYNKEWVPKADAAIKAAAASSSCAARILNGSKELRQSGC